MASSSIIVTMIIVARNAEMSIKNSIRSLINQGFSANEYEILIVDGLSDDSTINIAKDYLIKNKVTHTVFLNAEMTLASGWNIALKNAKGKYVVRPDAHAELSAGYVKIGIKKLENDHQLMAVGGVLNTKSDTYIGELISRILSNPIGVGASLFRVGVDEDTFSDTAVYAVYKKKVFDEVGYLDETLKRTQDIELHKRIISKGYTLLTTPDMNAIYKNRSTFKTFIGHAFRGGYWVGLSKAVGYRHMVPMLFLLATVTSVFATILQLTLYPMYILVVILSYILKSKEYNLLNLLLLTIMTFIYHLSYGLGTFFAKIKLLLKTIFPLFNFKIKL